MFNPNSKIVFNHFFYPQVAGRLEKKKEGEDFLTMAKRVGGPFNEMKKKKKKRSG